MLQMRARGFTLRDAFPELLNGIISQEEAQDYPTPTSQTPSIHLESKPIQENTSQSKKPVPTPCHQQ